MNYLEQIDDQNLPKHIGIIMDGNGRWAKKRNMPRSFGHREGMKRVVDIVEAACELGIQSLSLYAFSTENWKRPTEEVSKLMNLLVYYIRTQLVKLKENNVKVNVMGDISLLPEKVQGEVKRSLRDTCDNDKMILNIGLNYGGRNEIIRATKLIAKECEQGKISFDEIDEEKFSQYLYTAGQNDLDLLIRPSGELRISNFMLYQLAYAEFYFSNILWPDFHKEEFYRAIVEFQNRHRRFGGL